jgi:hypothetical protein
MPLFSALEDFMQRSLSALPTLWEKLQFVGDLREDGSGYRHWGLEQRFGEKAARAALTEAHNGLFNEVVSTRLAELWLAADQAAHREQLEVAEYLQKMRDSETALPLDAQGVAPEHFAFVVTNLCRVAHSRSTPSRQAA